jgi:hypothetical protein
MLVISIMLVKVKLGLICKKVIIILLLMYVKGIFIGMLV